MKYITNFFGVGCVVLLAMLFTAPGAFSQATHYVDTVNGSSTATTCAIATPCTLAQALTNAATAGDIIAVRVRREEGSVTIDDDAVNVAGTRTFAAYLRGSGALTKGTLNFTGTVTIADDAQFLRHKDVTVQFKDVVTTDEDMPDPFGRMVADQGSYSITGTWTTAAGAYGSLVVASDLTLLAVADDDNDLGVTVFVVDTLEVKSGATLTLGKSKRADGSDDENRIDLRVRLRKAVEAGAKDSKVDDMIVAGTIDGDGEIWLAHGSNESRTVDHDNDAGTDDLNGFHAPGEYTPNATGGVDHEDCVMISGGGRLGVKITAVAAGNVCVSLSETADVVAAGSIDSPTPATALATTDIIFRSDVTIDGSVYQWGDARVVFEKKATINGSVILDNGVVPTGFDGGIPTDLGTVRSGATDAAITTYVRTSMRKTEFAAAVDAVAEVLGDNPDTPETETDFVITEAVAAMPQVDEAYFTCAESGNRATAARGVAYSGVQFEADGNRIENDLSLRFDAATTRDAAPGQSEGGGTSAICKTQVVFWAPAGEIKSDVSHTSTVAGDLYIEDGGTVYLDGDLMKVSGTDRYVVHNLDLEHDVYVDGANGGSITMGVAADSNIDGECTTDASLGKGNRVTLTAGGDHVVAVGDMGLTIATLVIAGELEVQGGTLKSTVVHVTDKLVSNADVQIGSASSKGSLILEGNGLDGTLHSDSRLGKLTYASTGDELPLTGIDIVSINTGTGHLRIENASEIQTVGLCSGELVLVDTGNDKTNTLKVTEKLTVKDGKIVGDANAPGDIVGDGGDKAAAADGYVLQYVTEGAREAGLELSGARDLAVNHKDAEITLTEGADLGGKLHILKGTLNTMGDLTVGTSGVAADRFLVIHDGELNSNGNDVVAHDSVTIGATDKEVAKLMTGGGDFQAVGNTNAKDEYNGGTAEVTVGAKGVIDVGMGTFQLGPETTKPQDDLEGTDWQRSSIMDFNAVRPTVILEVKDGGSVMGTIDVPMGSKQTVLTGKSFDTVVFDGTKTPNVDKTNNADGTLYVFHNSKVTVDSLSATQGSVEFSGGDDAGNAAPDSVEIVKDVVLSSARMYFDNGDGQYANEVEFGGNLAVSGAGGVSVRNETNVTVAGNFAQVTTDEGGINEHEPEGTWLGGKAVKTVMGDFMVSGSGKGTSERYGSADGAKLILKGDFDFGLAKDGDVLAGTIEFSGKESQSVSSAVDLGNVEVNNSKGIVLGSNVMQGASSTLTLTRGIISSADDYTWTVKNTNIEEDLRGRNNALMTCEMDANCDSVIEGGSRRAHASTGVSRHVEQGNSGDGETSGGYLFPVGGMSGDMSHYRPLVLQFEDNLASADTVTVSSVMVPEGEAPSWPSDNILAPTLGGLLTLDAHSDIFWKVEFAEGVEQNPHVRIAAGGLANVFDVDGLRMVQWDCDWSNPRLAGTQIIGEANEASFAENGYVNGVPNLTNESVDVGMCAILGVAANGIENPIHLDPITGGLSRVQFIHNALLPAPVNLSLDGVPLQNNMEFRNATGYAVVASGSHEATFSVVGAPADQSTDVPLSLAPDASYAVVAHGSLTNYGVDVIETRMASLADNMVDAILVHGSADLGTVDVRLLDMTSDHSATALLANDIKFGESTNYLSFEPGFHNIEVLDSKESYVSLVSLNGYQGETVVLNLSGSKVVPGADFEIFGVDIRGGEVQAVTATDVEDERVELPTEFTLHGNYPNPFNPSTRIQFDLPETAQVSLQIVDMLGREVMTLPEKEFEAGANRSIEFNAINLASGTYLYRMIATGAESRYVKTGRMTLVK